LPLVFIYSCLRAADAFVAMSSHEPYGAMASCLRWFCLQKKEKYFMYPHPKAPHIRARLPYASRSFPRTEGETGCRRAHSHGGPAQPACSDSIITDNTSALFFGTFFCCSPVTKESTEYCLLFPFWSVMHSINVLFRMPYPAITSPPLYKLQNKFKEIALYFFPQKFSFPIETLYPIILSSLTC